MHGNRDDQMMVAKGLEGVIIDSSDICFIDGNTGRLSYGGYDIHDKDLFELARHVEETGIRVLYESYPRRKLYTNVEFYSTAVMHSAGLPPDLFTASFAASRNAGWSANVLEQVANNRLIRPEVEYTGPKDRTITQIINR